MFAALILKVTDFLRFLAAFVRGEGEQLSALITQLAAWLAGVAAVVVGAHAELTQHITLPGTSQALGTLNGWSQVLLGMMAASIASTAVDVKQAVDSTDSAARPRLVAAGKARRVRRDPD